MERLWRGSTKQRRKWDFPVFSIWGSLDPARTPAIDRKWFLGVLRVPTARLRAFADDKSLKNMKIPSKKQQNPIFGAVLPEPCRSRCITRHESNLAGSEKRVEKNHEIGRKWNFRARNFVLNDKYHPPGPLGRSRARSPSGTDQLAYQLALRSLTLADPIFARCRCKYKAGFS